MTVFYQLIVLTIFLCVIINPISTKRGSGGSSRGAGSSSGGSRASGSSKFNRSSPTFISSKVFGNSTLPSTEEVTRPSYPYVGDGEKDEEVGRVSSGALNLDPSYDHRVFPPGKGPVLITASVQIEQYSVDDKNSAHSMVLYLTQEWTDERLAFNSSNSSSILSSSTNNNETDYDEIKFYVTSPDETKIWLPDTILENEMSTVGDHNQNLLGANKYNSMLMIKPDGRVRYKRRYSARFACKLRLDYFPHDQQTCQVIISSFAHQTNQLKYQWKEWMVIFIVISDQPENFNVQEITPYSRDYSRSKGKTSQLFIDIKFARLPGLYVLRVYFPSLMLVIIAYLSTWMDKFATVSRILLSGLTLLLMMLLAFESNQYSPAAAGIRIIDIWFGACLFTIFSVIFETILVNYIWTKNAKIDNDPERNKEDKSENTGGTSKFDMLIRLVLPFLFGSFVFLHFTSLAKTFADFYF